MSNDAQKLQVWARHCSHPHASSHSTVAARARKVQPCARALVWDALSCARTHARTQDAMMAIHALWGAPCYIIAVLILLWFQVGWFMGLCGVRGPCAWGRHGLGRAPPSTAACERATHRALLRPLQVGWAMFVGLAVMLCLVPISGARAGPTALGHAGSQAVRGVHPLCAPPAQQPLPA